MPRIEEEMETVLQDIRYGLRMLRKSPGFTAVAVITLALGIGANTAIFSIVDAVILRPLPYRDPDRLVLVKERIPKATPDPISVCAADVVSFQKQNKSFASLAAFWGGEFDLAAGGGEPERVHVDRVNANLFSLLGTQPVLGRGFTAAEDQPGHLVAVLSYALWQHRFAADPKVIGRTLTLDRRLYTVIGVMPRSFVFPLPGMDQGEAAALFVPMAFTADELGDIGDNFNYSLLGRLKPGVSLARADVELEGIAHRIQETYPAQVRSDLNLGAVALRLQGQIVGRVKAMLLLLLGAVGCVLLIACINTANLLLTRNTDRKRELALRLALGARRGRLLRQFAVESMLLVAGGAALGLAIAFWTNRALPALIPANVPRIHPLGINWTVLAFTAGVAVLCGLAFGIVPALAAPRMTAYTTLKESGRGGMEGLEHHRVRAALVITEVALAMVLLVGAGLLLRSFQHVVESDPGFQPEHVLTASLALPSSHYAQVDQMRSFYQQLLRRLQQLPGITAAGASTDLPLEARWVHLFTPEGYQPPPGAALNSCSHSVILGRYLQAMGVPLLQGRYFTEQDKQGSTPVLIVSQALAQRYWPHQNPIGKRLKWGPANSTDPWLTIVGVVGDVKQSALDVKTRFHTYQPYLQNPGSSLDIAIRAQGDPASRASELRTAVWMLDPQLAVAQVRTMEQVISESSSPRRFNLLLLGSFAFLALTLAAIGIYGVISYSVARRTHEIGVRIALGAQHGDVMHLVLGQSLLLLGIGLAVGAVGALNLTRFLASFLYGIRPTDPATFASVVVILAGVALLASYVPARRAAKVDPMEALRYE